MSNNKSWQDEFEWKMEKLWYTPQGELLIVPDADHGSYIYHSTRVGDLLLDFFGRIGY